MVLTALDGCLLAVAALSILLGLLRGVVRELISIAAWVVGVMLAFRYAGLAAEHLPLAFGYPMLRTVLAGGAILFGVLLVSALMAWVLARLLAFAHLTVADRLLGAVFGLARAALLLLVVVALLGDTAVARQPGWRASRLLVAAEAALRWVMPLLPHPPRFVA